MTREEFDAQWRLVALQVERACRRALSDPALAADVCQEVSMRAWRGSATFRGDCPFNLWVLQIARNEINRAIRRLVLQRMRETSLESVPAESEHLTSGATVEVEQPGLSFSALVAHAADTGELTAQESHCVLERLRNPDASWHHIGATLGISGAHCAVLHCRAIPKLRAYLFVNHRDRFASPEVIEEAIRMAAADAAQPLTAPEEESFRRAVLERGRHARYSLRDLRAACGKIVSHLGADATLMPMP